MNQSYDKNFILSEIKRTAADNGDRPLGQGRFSAETGITNSKWRGRYWRSWGDALTEAGFEPIKPAERTEDAFVIEKLANLTRKLGFFPTYVDYRLEKLSDTSFPTHNVISRLGSRDERVKLLHDFATSNEEYSSILQMLPEIEIAEAPTELASSLVEGFVYLALMKMGNAKRYKVGKAVLTARRIDQISIQLPEDLSLVHYITTDDAFGIEAYWHKRFLEKNTKGEWFMLSQSDVNAFKKRKFM